MKPVHNAEDRAVGLADRPITVSVNEACRLSGLGKTTLYKLLAENKLRSAKVAARRLIFLDSLQNLLDVISSSPLQGGEGSEAP